MAPDRKTKPPVAPDLSALPPSGYVRTGGRPPTKANRTNIGAVVDPWEHSVFERVAVARGRSLSDIVRQGVRALASDLRDEDPALDELLTWLEWRDEQLAAGRDPSIMRGRRPEDGFLDEDGRPVEWQPGVLPGHGPALQDDDRLQDAA
ncbi:hypothetical protein GKE82_24055 [Conexibacter sp. W3-3-2]|uniref:hypothetical protein n=1 Tax=Conexibacter sp. W3-3-2 TaxID=2675227 RepID=UPI0012B7CEAE|nr:hypothetical protein [Conexibacter sp. W3-3-2]MTD47282.1 hypothetical protein [Conexibacter sp. W3-3-2]